MDKQSSCDDLQFPIEEGLNAAVPRYVLPNQSLLDQIRILTKSHETSIPCEGTLGTWRYNFEFTPYMGHDFWTLEWEIMLQQMVFKLLQNHGVMSQALSDIKTIAETEAEPVRVTVAGINAHNVIFDFCTLNFRFLESAAFVILQIIYQKIKPPLKEFCLGIVNRLLQGDSFSSSSSSMAYDISEFNHIILLKLKDLRVSKPNLIAPVKKQMQTLEELLYLACIIGWKDKNIEKKYKNFLVNFQPWVNIAVALVIMYWVDEKDEGVLAFISSSLESFDLSIPELVEVYILVIKVLKPSNVSEILLMREIVGRFIDTVLQNLNVSIDVHFEIFREGLILCVALLLNPPQADTEEEKSICVEINLLVDKAKSFIPSLCRERIGEFFFEERDNLLTEFLEMIYNAKVEVGKLHLEMPGYSWKNTPKTSRRGHLDFLLGNLKRKLEAEPRLFPFEKHLIAIVHEELSFLRASLMDIFELQDEHKELTDIWVQTSNMAYLVDYVTDSCLSSTNIPTWANLMHLSNAIEEIQSIKNEISKIKQNDQMYNNRVISSKLSSQIVLPKQQEAYATIDDNFKVGFIEDEQRIIDCLVAGEARRDIVAAVGMPGQGKTFIAKRTFQDTCIKHHFNKLSWCCISQAYDIKKIFVDILEDVDETVSPEQFQCLTQEDLADRLRKCLKRQRCLVVLDDMWDGKLWCDIQLSFPDDNNGSRILLTSRNRNVALEVKANCSIVELHPLSHEESWNLLQMKVFHGDCCPLTLSDIGKTIAENCKGLPLAVVVVAGLLKKDINMDSWKQISENIKSHFASESCMNILELSYKNLPEYLKPCFLYLGAFQEDKIIDAKQLMQFWMAEGFVQSDGLKTREVIAKEYLIELVSRSLVSVAQRSSRNGIKKCRVHDLLHQLCLVKGQEEGFLLVPDVVRNHYSTLNTDHFRISVHEKWGPFFDSKSFDPGLRSLFVSVNCSVYASYMPGLLKEFKLIRVLDLANATMKQTDFHDITQLIHLRLLAVGCRNSIPPSIVNLLRLEVLRLNTGGLVALPNLVIKMASLRHIFVRTSCTIEYTEDFDKMVSDFSSPLTNLETFTLVYFHDKLSFKRVAHRLPNILKFGIRCYFCARLSSYFKKLESLKLQIYFPRRQESEVISPSTLDFPLTLKKLNLTVRGRFSGAMISSIGKLSNLEALKLNAQFENDRWDVEDDEFLQLKYFDFRFSSIQEWNLSIESFPCLEQLFIRKCPQLGELPSRFGSITTLERIQVHKCSHSLLNSFVQIVDDQMDAGNEALQFSIS